jgi:hypothetical protein
MSVFGKLKNVGTGTGYWYLITGIHGDVNVNGIEFIFLITPEDRIRIRFKHFCNQEFNFIRIYIFTSFYRICSADRTKEEPEKCMGHYLLRAVKCFCIC